jgi:ubiquitin C-terminal hydrolase
VKTIFELPVGLHLKETDFVLQGVIAHKESSETGHCSSYVRESGDSWLCFNDTHILRVTQQHVLEEGKKLAYILFDSQRNADGVTIPEDLQGWVERQNAS